MKNTSLYLFQRALRIDDNLGFIECCKKSSNVLPVFCVDPRQVDSVKNSFFSAYAVGFMYQSLLDLDKELQKLGTYLHIVYGEPHIVLPKICKKYNIQNIYCNKDYTPFAIQRSRELQEIGNLVEVDDYLLFDPKDVKNKSGKAYKVYTPFLRVTKNKKITKPVSFTYKKTLTYKGSGEKKAWNILQRISKFSEYYTPGGRTEALQRIENIEKTQKNYASCRDYLTYKTSRLSAYIKFGCISIREAWYAFLQIPGKSGEGLRNQLIWREFYYQMYIDYPELVEWDKNPKEAVLDKKAPDIVRACFNQLDRTGYLHNRGRMILANYLLHTQKEYWKSCDKMYARRLVDYDPFVNIGNWLWIKKQPSFRQLKPEVQYKKWDTFCPKDTSNTGENGSYTKMFLEKKIKS